VPGELSYEQLWDCRLRVLLLHPPGEIQPVRVEAREAEGRWREVDLGKSYRARQLVLLLLRADGGLESGQIDAIMTAPTDMPTRHASNALKPLRAALEDSGAGAHLLVSGTPGEGAEPWRLIDVTSDVELAAAALEHGDVEKAADLTLGGEAVLAGVVPPESPPEPWVTTSPDGALPAALAETAEGVLAEVRARQPEPEVKDPAVKTTAVDPGAPVRSTFSERARLVIAGALVVLLAVVAVAALTGGGADGGGRGGGPAEPERLTAGRWEQQWPKTDVKTFRSPYRLNAAGPLVRPRQRVIVACRVHAETIPSSQNWYRIVSPPWKGRFVAPSNTFLNGDPIEWYEPGGKPPKGAEHSFDPKLAPCSGPPGSLLRTQAPGVRTYEEPNLSGASGPIVGTETEVIVGCRVTAGDEVAYRIMSSPWNGKRYASAEGFERVKGGAYDPAVPDCGRRK
jgi:hypothetical protein